MVEHLLSGHRTMIGTEGKKCFFSPPPGELPLTCPLGWEAGLGSGQARQIQTKGQESLVGHSQDAQVFPG